MKKFLLLVCALLTAGSGYADFAKAGYYRLKNVYTKRYVTVIDDECKYVNFTTGKIDGHSLFTQQDFDEVCHDPASVIYAARISGSHYDVAAQGISMKNMMNYNIYLGESGKEGDQIAYRIYSTEKGVTKYLADSGGPSKTTGSIIFGTPSAASASSQAKCKWLILPVEASSDCFFGVLPTIDANDGYWASLFASFPYSASSEGVEFYYPCATSYTGLVEMKKLEGVIPGGFPIMVKCKETKPSLNRLNVGGNSTIKVSDNKMRGQYFNCYVPNGTDEAGNKVGFVNRLPYDPATMRVPGRCADGSLGFITDESLEFIPANTGYITVLPWYPKELKCVFSHDEFVTGIDAVADGGEKAQGSDVYSTTGQLIMRHATETQISSLPKGIYIVGNRKRVVK